MNVFVELHFPETQLMSSTLMSEFKGSVLLLHTIRRLNASGGMRAYYKGVVAATIGVFPYSGMCMFSKSLATVYLRWL